MTAIIGCEGNIDNPPIAATANEVTHTIPARFADETEPIEHVFDVPNHSHRVLKIAEVKKSCTCTEASLSSFEIRPGEKAILALKTNPSGRLGRFAAQVTLVVPGHDNISFRIETEIVPRIKFAPESIQLGALDPGTPTNASASVLTYSRNGDPPRPMLSVAKTDSAITAIASGGELTSLPNGFVERRTSVSIAVTCAEGAEFSYGELIATIADADKNWDATLRLFSHPKPVFRVSPPRVFFGKIADDSADLAERLTISRFDGLPFQLMVPGDDVAGIHCLLEKTEDELVEYKVVVRLNPGLVNGPFYRNLVLNTDDPRHPTITIPVAAAR